MEEEFYAFEIMNHYDELAFGNFEQLEKNESDKEKSMALLKHKYYLVNNGAMI